MSPVAIVTAEWVSALCSTPLTPTGIMVNTARSAFRALGGVVSTVKVSCSERRVNPGSLRFLGAVEMMDKPDGLPTSPQAQQQRHDVIKRVLAVSSNSRRELNRAAKLSNDVGPAQCWTRPNTP